MSIFLEKKFPLITAQRTIDDTWRFKAKTEIFFHVFFFVFFFQTFQLNEGSRIAWMNGKPPVDTPPCGYYNEKCQVPKGKNMASYWNIILHSL